MKKVLYILLIIFVILLLGFGIFYFFGGKEKVSNFFGESDFGSFFDTNPQSQNDIVFDTPTIDEVPFVEQSYSAPVLRQISFEPISGYTYYATTSTSTRPGTLVGQEDLIEEFVATSTVVRFQERATGHIYDVFEFLSAGQKVSNITMQKIYNTIFTSNKNIFLYQVPTFNNEQILTTLVQLILPKTDPETGIATELSTQTSELSSVFRNLLYIPSTNKIIYSVTQVNGSSIYTADTNRSNEKLILTLPFNEFTLDLINDKTLLVQTKASADAVGYAYTLDIGTGRLTKFIGNTKGLLTKMSPDLNYFLSSESISSGPVVRAHDVKTNTVRQVGIDTIPSKCDFSQVNNEEIYCFGSLQYKPGTYPDDWYKGKIFNSESLYKINLENGTVEIVYLFGEDQIQDFDIKDLTITNNDNFAIFTNKYDLTLWSLNLKKIAEQNF